MRIILGGYLETALVRYADAIIRPGRNNTSHLYYASLNRPVPKAFFDRAATFVALAEKIAVPNIDWSLAGDEYPALSQDRLGVSINEDALSAQREWDSDSRIFAGWLIDNRALSEESWIHATKVDWRTFYFEAGTNVEAAKSKIRVSVAEHYLCRLFLQLRSAKILEGALALCEPDIEVLRDIGAFLTMHNAPTPYPFPNLTDSVLDADNFAAGLLNFSPPDALALAAVKSDAIVQRYASRVRPYLASANSTAAQSALLDAMREAHRHAEAGRKAEKIFEVVGWAAKPLHYIPGVGEALTFAEDAKDVISSWVDRESSSKEWYILAAKMTDIAVTDYLARKDNQLA